MAANLNDVVGWIKDIYYRLRKLESGSMLESSSITSGRMRFIGGTLMIDSGGQFVVIGSASVDGTMTIDGTFLLTGSGWRIVGSGSIEGPTTVVGTLQIDGDTRITGNLGIEGDTSLTGTLDVDGTGRILVGDNMRLDPSTNGGSLKFAGGPEVYASGGQLGLYSTGAGGYITLDGTAGEFHGPGLAKVTVTATQIFLQGATPVTESDAGGDHKPGAYIRLASGALGYVVPD